MQDTIKFCKGATRVIAHRGLSGIEKENTCAAFVAAGNRSYFGIETDIHLTADGKLIVNHNDSVRDVSGRTLEIASSTFDGLRALRLSDSDGKSRRCDLAMPEPGEYISICKRYGKRGVLELKNEFDEAALKKVLSVIDSFGYAEGMIVISFSLDNLLRLRTLRPDLKAQYLVSKYFDGLINVLRDNHLGLDISYKELDARLVGLCHKNGTEVNCWTVNSRADGERMASYGVDYITTNILE